LPSQTDGVIIDTPVEARPHEEATGPHRSGGPIEAIKYHISGAASTSDLPDGRPESEMKNIKEHALGHLARKKPGS
jgi:hypothetical protein